MILNTVSDVLLDLHTFQAAIIKKNNCDCMDEIAEYITPFLNTLKVDYAITWLNNGNLSIRIHGKSPDDFKKIGNRISELLITDLSIMNSLHKSLITVLLRDVKATFDVTQINENLFEIKLY